jgi:LysR family transcriptional activator of dmlA
MWPYDSRIVNLNFQLDDLRVFCLAARKASFAATAIELGTSPAYVSKRIAILGKSRRPALSNVEALRAAR